MNIQAYVFNIQPYSLHDGPGIRTNVFLKGCPLHCSWCCNPESQSAAPDLFFVESKCITQDKCGYCSQVCQENAISFTACKLPFINRESCTHCFSCVGVCPSQSLQIQGRKMTVSEVMDEVEKDSMFYRYKGGGLTISGGEPLMQGEFLIALLKEAKLRRINTAMETCGFGNYEILKGAAAFLDTLFFDIKSTDTKKHKAFTGQSCETIINNFNHLCEDFPSLKKVVRTPVIPSFNDTEKELEDILAFIKDKPGVSYELMPYHKYGEGKYKALGRTYPLGDSRLDKEWLEQFKAKHNL